MTNSHKDPVINQKDDAKEQKSGDIKTLSLVNKDYFISCLTAQISNGCYQSKLKSQNPPNSCDALIEIESIGKAINEEMVIEQVAAFQSLITDTLFGDKCSAIQNMLASFPHASLLEDQSHPLKKEVSLFSLKYWRKFPV